MSSENAILSAVKAVMEGSVSENKAAKLFGVSRTTLRRHLADPSIGPQGRPTKFTAEEELAIKDLLLSCARLGVPLSKIHLRKIFIALSIEKGLPEQTFSETWHTNFLNRHPRISQRISQAENRKKARQWTEELCLQYVAVVAGLKVDGFLTNPHGVWNLDESGFALGGRYSKVYAEKGTKEVLLFFDGDDRSQLTVLACGSAAGKMLRPLILYDGVMNLASRVEETDDNFLVATNNSRWMDNAVFTAYIVEELIPAMPLGKNLICVDGHSSHVYNLNFIQACMQAEGREIQILVFPAGQTGKLQPLDKSVFGGVKYNWRRHLSNLHLNTEGYQQLTRNPFPAHLNLMWPKLHLEESLTSGFQKIGLFPHDPSIILANVKVTKPRAAVSPSLFDEESIVRGSLARWGLASVEVNTIICSVKHKLTGTSAGYDIAECMNQRLNGNAPEKKRKTKDTRLSAEAGKLWCTSTVVEALKERAEKATEGDKKNNRPKVVKKSVKKVARKV